MTAAGATHVGGSAFSFGPSIREPVGEAPPPLDTAYAFPVEEGGDERGSPLVQPRRPRCPTRGTAAPRGRSRSTSVPAGRTRATPARRSATSAPSCTSALLWMACSSLLTASPSTAPNHGWTSTLHSSSIDDPNADITEYTRCALAGKLAHGGGGVSDDTTGNEGGCIATADALNGTTRAETDEDVAKCLMATPSTSSTLTTTLTTWPTSSQTTSATTTPTTSISVTVAGAGGSGYKSKSRLLSWVRHDDIDSETKTTVYTVETGLVSCDNQIVNDSVTVTRVCSSICKSKSRLDSCVDLEVNDLRSETAVSTSETGVVSCRNLALIDSVPPNLAFQLCERSSPTPCYRVSSVPDYAHSTSLVDCTPTTTSRSSCRGPPATQRSRQRPEPLADFSRQPQRRPPPSPHRRPPLPSAVHVSCRPARRR